MSEYTTIMIKRGTRRELRIFAAENDLKSLSSAVQLLLDKERNRN